MSKPLISIVTVVRNGAPFITSCVFSVQAAGFRSFEHVIIDGGSTDGSVEIAAELAQKVGDTVRLISKPDRSMTEGLRNACSVAGGRWILPLNIDDQYLPEAGSRVEALLEGSEDEFVLFDVVVRRASGRIKHVVRPWMGNSVLAWDLLGCFAAECGVALQSRALEAVGGYDMQYRLAADYDLYLKLARRGRVRYSGLPLGVFNEVGDNLSIKEKSLILAEAGSISRFGGLYARMQMLRLDKLLRVLALIQVYHIGARK